MTTSANTTTTTTVNTNLREFLTPRSDNTPSGPIVKVETKTEYNHQTKITSTAIVQSIDVKATNTTNLSATKKSFSKEVMAGKKIGSAEAGLFSSVKITNENNKNTKQCWHKSKLYYSFSKEYLC